MIDLAAARRMADNLNDSKAPFGQLNAKQTILALCDEVERLQQDLADARMSLHDRTIELERCQAAQSGIRK